MVVNSSQGGGSKDTWVLAGGSLRESMLPQHDPFEPPTMPDLPQVGWSEQGQQQQQQTRLHHRSGPGAGEASGSESGDGDSQVTHDHAPSAGPASHGPQRKTPPRPQASTTNAGFAIAQDPTREQIHRNHVPKKGLGR